MPIDHFNLIANFYDRLGKFKVGETLLGLLSLDSSSLLLDAGGGTGRVASALREMVKKVVVADLSVGMLRQADNKGLEAICAPAEFLPFPPGSFDRVIMVDALHHVMDQRQTCNELWRILSPGGRILIIEPDIRKPLVKAIAIGEKLLLMRSHFLTGVEIKSLFTDPDVMISLFNDDLNIFLVAEKVK